MFYSTYSYLLANYICIQPSHILYARHHNPLLIRNRSWILTIHKGRIFWKNLLEKTFFTFKKWVKSIQTASYNGARTVCIFWPPYLVHGVFERSLSLTNCTRQKYRQNALLCNGLMPPVDAALCFSFRFTLAFSKTNNWWCFDIRPIGRGCSGQCHHVQEVSSTARC